MMSQTASNPQKIELLPSEAECGQDLRAEKPIDPVGFSALHRRALLEGCKWDPQVGDESTLASFPLVMKATVWKRLATQAEKLSVEAIAAEEEVLDRRELLGELGLPRSLQRLLGVNSQASPSAGRVMRFDFHPTSQGWRISEANSDVPGGFSESSFFTSLIAEHFPELRPAGNPAEAWAGALSLAAGRPGGVIGLLSAPGYMEDHQVIAFLGAKLRTLGCRAYLSRPGQIIWRDSAAHLETKWYRGPVDVIVRFYQAEWVSKLPTKSRWIYLFRGGKTRVANPGQSIISESKRFPLIWEKLSTTLPTWRALLPETCDPRTVPWRHDDAWVLKSALCNNGDTVLLRELLPAGRGVRAGLSARLCPGGWVAQRRFESLPISTPVGPRHACIGIYTVNGQVAGAYARLATKPLIDFEATDAALLLEDDE